MPRVLLVEDNRDTADMIRRLLEPEGYEIDHQMSGLGGIRAARTQRPDIILMDFNLPDIDGSNVVLLLKKQLGGRNAPPIVAVTARGGENEEQYARRMGCDAFVSKPINPPAFLGLVNDLVARSSSSGV